MLIPVQYHNQEYPPHIIPRIAEVAAHFDIEKIRQDGRLSIHTEYSYRPRRFDTILIKQFPTLTLAHLNYVPKLWHNKQWSIEFAIFIQILAKNKEVAVIEIHPPFIDYSTMDNFISNYAEFEKIILNIWPDVDIVIENRSGTTYRGGRFLISRVRDLIEFVAKIEKTSLRLNIALDVPQLFTAHGGPSNFTNTSLRDFLFSLIPIIYRVNSIHLWGKRRTLTGRILSHMGDLNSYFDNDLSKKEVFLNSLVKLLGDCNKRYFVPEVNSTSEDLQSIVRDLEGAGIRFMAS